MSEVNTATPVIDLESDDTHDNGDGVNYSGHFQTDTNFPSFDDAVDWAKGIARRIGFLLTKASYKNSHDGRPIRYLACDRGKKSTTRNLEKAIRKNTKSKANSCPFYIKIEYERYPDGWKIFCKNDITGTHNHPFVVYPEGYRQISGLSQGAKQVVRDLTKAQVAPRKIMATLVKKYPNDRPNIRQVYNCRKDIRMEQSEGRELIQQVLRLAKESKYVTWLLADTNNVIQDAFMAHPNTIKLLRTYPYVIGMDSTYKTNQYGMPFFEIVGVTPTKRNFLVGYVFMRSETEESYRWMLEKLRVLIGHEREPSVFLSDCEFGLSAPLRDVFPKTTHLFCRRHVNKEVEAYVSGFFIGEKSIAETFTDGFWKSVMDALSEDEFEQALDSLKIIWSAWPKLTDYVEGTWLVHKEKFVTCWTNQVLHFGNVYNCRVKSQHSALKSFIDSATEDLDTIWARVHDRITTYINGIRYGLKADNFALRRISRYEHHKPLKHINGQVSDQCLSILDDETVRMRELGKVYQHCGCVLRITHGIPCACHLYTLIVTETKYYMNRIHPFWKTGIIFEVANMSDFSAEEAEHFNSIVDKVHATSHFNINDFRYGHLLPEIILPYIVGWKDVVSDGNCGFRCVANFFMGDQENWRLIRQTIANEIAAYPGLYSKIYLEPEGLDYQMRRIRWSSESCEEDHWMEIIRDLFPIATLYNAMVIFYGNGHTPNDIYPCCTVLPLRALDTATAPCSEFVIAIVEGSHIIQLELGHDHPVPPIADFWFRFREPSVVGWEQQYEHRINSWHELAAFK